MNLKPVEYIIIAKNKFRKYLYSVEIHLSAFVLVILSLTGIKQWNVPHSHQYKTYVLVFKLHNYTRALCLYMDYFYEKYVSD
jgi:hypothetical protein